MPNEIVTIDHSTLPDVSNALLPARYEAAKVALAECVEMDECQDWADKMAALASYARQANDDTLMKYAMRVQARAIRRCGELLKAVEPASGRQPENGSSPPRFTRESAATEAGLSERQRKTALRVANVPEEEFEGALESEEPPTVTELAERGTERRPIDTSYLEGRDPKDYQAATQFIGLPRDFMREAGEMTDLARIARGLSNAERVQARLDYIDCMNWINDAWDFLDGL